MSTYESGKKLLSCMYRKNNFVEISKNLARYRSENDSVEFEMIMYDAINDCY